MDNHIKMDKIINKIVQGEKVDLSDYYEPEFYEQLFVKLKSHTTNVNCMYTASFCLLDDDPRHEEYLQKAIKLGSHKALFNYGHLKRSIKIGYQAFRSGFRRPNDINNYRDYYDLVLLEHIDKLEKQVKSLTTELEQERLRPPELGGTDYVNAKNDFNHLRNITHN